MIGALTSTITFYSWPTLCANKTSNKTSQPSALRHKVIKDLLQIHLGTPVLPNGEKTRLAVFLTVACPPVAETAYKYNSYVQCMVNLAKYYYGNYIAKRRYTYHTWILWVRELYDFQYFLSNCLPQGQKEAMFKSVNKKQTNHSTINIPPNTNMDIQNSHS